MYIIFKNLKKIIPLSILRFLLLNFPPIANRLSLLFWKSMIKKGDTVIQGGADMGWKQSQLSASNVFKIAKLIGEDGMLYVIESDKENYQLLKKYIKDRAIKNIIPINNAIWDESKVLKFKKGKRSNDSQLIEYVDSKNVKVNNYWEDEYDVQTITLDSLIKSYNFKKIDFICLTINGAEYEALLGCTLIIKKYNPNFYIAANHQDVRPMVNGIPYQDVIIEVLNRHKYDTYVDGKGWIVGEKNPNQKL